MSKDDGEQPWEILRERSGKVNSRDPFVMFLYVLMRDHIPSGIVEDIISKHTYEEETEFSNGWLAKHAMDIAERLRHSE